MLYKIVMQLCCHALAEHSFVKKIIRVFIQHTVEAAFGIDIQLPSEIKIVLELHCLFIWVGQFFPFSILAPTVTECC